MKLAVLADIHGNYVALEACLSLALSRGIRSFVFLGDYLGDMAFPERTMELLYELREKYECRFIRGNREEYWLSHARAGTEGNWKDFDSTTGCLVYTYSHLRQKDLDFFGELPIVRRLKFDGLPELVACHGSPFRVDEKLMPERESTFAVMERAGASVILCGHTHQQGKILHAGVRLLNAGSVGLPLDCGGPAAPLQAQFLILHGEGGEWTEEFISLSYDVERVVRELYEAELDRHAPYWCRITERMLRTGAGDHGITLSKAMELCRAQEGECIWPEIPEKYWKQAWEQETGQSPADDSEGGRL